jgi:ankyrin repeat protein
VASVLLKRGAYVSAIDSLGQTPLHTAALRGHQRLARVLLDAGAVLASADLQQATNGKGLTSLQLAVGGGHTEVAKLLGAMRVLLAAGWRYKDGQTLLHWAASTGHAEEAKVLLDAGSNVAAQDRTGKTPLRFAVEGGHATVATVLLDAGASMGDTAEKNLRCVKPSVLNPEP